jgi:hypothetical protein
MKDFVRGLMQVSQDDTTGAWQGIVWVAQNAELTAWCSGIVVGILAFSLVWYSWRLNKRTSHYSKRRAPK